MKSLSTFSSDENESGKKLKVLRTDNGGEYTSSRFEEFLRCEGVWHERTIPKTPEQNGVAERINRTLVETGSMLIDSKLPQKFWGEALSTAVYLRNRSPTKAVRGMTPYEAWTKGKAGVGHLRIFGCDAYAHVPKMKEESSMRKQKCTSLLVMEKRPRVIDCTTQHEQRSSSVETSCSRRVSVIQKVIATTELEVEYVELEL